MKSAVLPAPEHPTTDDRQVERSLGRNLAASVGDGAAFGVMVGVGETYLPAFTLAAGLGEVFAVLQPV